MATTLVINPGSSSRKYALYDQGSLVLELRFEQTDTGFEMCSRTSSGKQTCEAVVGSDYKTVFKLVVDEIKKVLERMSVGKRIDNVAVRVVAPGTMFQKHSKVDAEYIKKLKSRMNSAPLHVPMILREIEAVKQEFEGVPIIAASDSEFYSKMPESAREYSIPKEDIKNHDIHRFGYHGLSVASVVRRMHSLIGQDPKKMIVCHVGNGVSVTAVKDGIGVDTTMGMSPASGLPMGSRAGDVDASALLELMRLKNMKVSDAETYLNTRGGLIGLAENADIRYLLDRSAQNDQVASEALDSFVYNIQKAIVSQTIALQSFDMLVLTATAAVRSNELRSLILSGLAHLGVVIDEDKNSQLIGKDGVISAKDSKVKVIVMRTDEMGEMAQVAAQFDH